MCPVASTASSALVTFLYGTFPLSAPYLQMTVLTDGIGSRPINTGRNVRNGMDSRWNWFIDNVPVRVTLNTVVWCLWIAATVGILEFAAKFLFT